MPMSTPLIGVAGVSYGLTQFKNDYVDYADADIPVKDVIKVN